MDFLEIIAFIHEILSYEQLSEPENSEFVDLCEMAGRFSDDEEEELKIPNMYYSKDNILDKARYVKQKLENDTNQNVTILSLFP